MIRTRAEPLGIEIKVGVAPELMKSSDYFGVLAQYPSTTGQIHDMRPFVEQAHASGALFCVATDLLALTLLEAPGKWGSDVQCADIAVGNSQRFGVPFGFGGPHAAFLACRDAFKRSMPGRLVGVSIDSQGNPAYRLTLQTREQHIRREKATSNICTAQVLLAVIASMYAVYHGPDGLTRIARRVHRLTKILAEGLKRVGLQVNGSYFDTLTVSGVDAAKIHTAARAAGINLREFSPRDFGERAAKVVGIALDETATRADVQALWRLFGVSADIDALDREIDAAGGVAIPAELRRQSPFLTHPVFNAHHSEHEMLRYMRALADKDLALDRSMIPLGSCTMKLNATSEMIPVTWPEFADMHPLAPADQSEGYRQLIDGTRADAGRVHRIRRGQPAAELGRAGRIRGPAGHPRLSPLARRGPPQHLPDSRERARHQSGLGALVRHGSRAGQDGPQRQRRRR